MGIKELLMKIKERRDRINDISEEDRAVTTFQERKKNANEREYERYMEERRQMRIEQELQRFRKQKSNDIWHKDVITQKPMFKHKPIFGTGGCLLGWK